jgi:hypothetical protein
MARIELRVQPRAKREKLLEVEGLEAGELTTRLRA